MTCPVRIWLSSGVPPRGDCLGLFGCIRESFVAMKQAMVVSRMSHVMIKLFAPWVSWKVLPYSGKIALLFVLHTVALLIIVVANSPASRLVGVVSFQVGNAMAENTFLSLGTFYGDVDVGFEGGVLSPKPHPCHPPPFSPFSVPVLCPIY